MNKAALPSPRLPRPRLAPTWVTGAWIAAATIALSGCSPVHGSDAGADEDAAGADAQESPPSASVEEYTAGLPPLDPASQEACLPGNWYPKLDEWAELRGAGLQLPVEHRAGGFVLMIDAALQVTRDTWELEYRITDDGSYLNTVENGETTWALEVTAAGARTIRDSQDLTGFTANTIITEDGSETHVEELPVPIVFDRETLRCDGDHLTLINPFGEMTLGREH